MVFSRPGWMASGGPFSLARGTISAGTAVLDLRAGRSQDLAPFVVAVFRPAGPARLVRHYQRSCRGGLLLGHSLAGHPEFG
jgi:hypothetical protein